MHPFYSLLSLRFLSSCRLSLSHATSHTANFLSAACGFLQTPTKDSDAVTDNAGHWYVRSSSRYDSLTNIRAEHYIDHFASNLPRDEGTLVYSTV